MFHSSSSANAICMSSDAFRALFSQRCSHSDAFHSCANCDFDNMCYCVYVFTSDAFQYDGFFRSFALRIPVSFMDFSLRCMRDDALSVARSASPYSGCVE